MHDAKVFSTIDGPTDNYGGAPARRGRYRAGVHAVAGAAASLTLGRWPRPGWLVVIVALLPLSAGCVQRNVERIDAEEAALLPPPPPPQAPSRQSGDAAPTTTRIAGVVELDPALGATIPEGATLYLVVRVAGRETGAPLAVQQVRSPTFPHNFEITEQDAMIAGTPLIGEMSVTARVDQDGDAFTTDLGDLSGQISPVVAGASDIVLRIDRRVEGG